MCIYGEVMVKGLSIVITYVILRYAETYTGATSAQDDNTGGCGAASTPEDPWTLPYLAVMTIT